MASHAKESEGKLKYIFIFIIIMVALAAGIYFIINNKGKKSTMTSTESQKSITERTEKEKEITIEDFKTKLEESGLTISDTIQKSAELIGAEEGIGYEIDGTVIEVYKFNENSTDDLTKTNIESAKKDGKINMATFNMTLNVKYNKGLCLIGYENHPDKEKILEVFNSL